MIFDAENDFECTKFAIFEEVAHNFDRSNDDMINALSFYESKMILSHPNPFGRVPIVLDGSNLFWWRPNHFGKVQIIKISSKKVNLNMTKLFGPKTFWMVQNNNQ